MCLIMKVVQDRAVNVPTNLDMFGCRQRTFEVLQHAGHMTCAGKHLEHILSATIQQSSISV